MNYIYHILPPNLEGSVLYPLNELKNIKPQVYAAHAKKYEGREDLMDFIIPHLNVKWNDVLFFSAINSAIFNLNYNKIPITDLPEDKTVVYLYNNTDVNKITKLEQIVKLDYKKYKEPQELSQISLDYYDDCIKNNKKILNFVGVPHIMFSASLDISKYMEK